MAFDTPPEADWRPGPIQQLIGRAFIPGRKSARQVNEDFLEWVDEEPDRPFFAHPAGKVHRKIVCSRPGPTDTKLSPAPVNSATAVRSVLARAGNSSQVRHRSVGVFHPGKSTFIGCARASNSMSFGT
jgi:hypothetical protein